MQILIIKLGATGDVVRTTTLLRLFTGDITWVTAAGNASLLQAVTPAVRCVCWEARELCRDREYDLVINLEDTPEVAQFAGSLEYRRLWGACLDHAGSLSYTEDARDWFDLSIISRHGKEPADRLKLANRATYQELIFRGLGATFRGETYVLPETNETDLRGDVAIAAEAGAVWPMKRWAYYDELEAALAAEGLVVNRLPKRPTLLEHLADVRGHRCLVSGDTLPMHFALGSAVKCVSLFTCTSPWEIHDYGLQRKLVSPLLEQFFYQRSFNHQATAAISLDEVVSAALAQLGSLAEAGY